MTKIFHLFNLFKFFLTAFITDRLKKRVCYYQPSFSLSDGISGSLDSAAHVKYIMYADIIAPCSSPDLGSPVPKLSQQYHLSVALDILRHLLLTTTCFTYSTKYYLPNSSLHFTSFMFSYFDCRQYT